MKTCSYCLTAFAHTPRTGGTCSRRCANRLHTESHPDQEKSLLDGLFLSVQGGLMKIDLGLAEDGQIAEET